MHFPPRWFEPTKGLDRPSSRFPAERRSKRHPRRIDMFEKLGQIASLMKNLPKMQEEMSKLKGKIAQLTADGEAGAGMVKVKANGHMELLISSCILGRFFIR